MSLPRSPSQFELARQALAIRAPPNNENWSSHSVGARSPNSPYSPPVFNRLASSYASVDKAVPSFRKSRKNRKNRKASRKNRKASRKNRRANRKASRKNRKSRN